MDIFSTLGFLISEKSMKSEIFLTFTFSISIKSSKIPIKSTNFTNFCVKSQINRLKFRIFPILRLQNHLKIQEINNKIPILNTENHQSSSDPRYGIDFGLGFGGDQPVHLRLLQPAIPFRLPATFIRLIGHQFIIRWGEIE